MEATRSRGAERRTVLVRLAIAILPLAFAPVFLHLVGDGYLNLGGGEKDVLLVMVWTLWAAIFAAIFVVLWMRRWPVLRSTIWSAGLAVAMLVAAAVFLVATGHLGVS